ncbi:MAG: flagellar basal body P-ring formation chaperone FlgA [Nitrospirales bacterium]|nr:flagellar basal body P-ring formation protein FlgA [Nitrospira sp.]MDR4502331.1 flagellar basal body P-ring formation chaperone FlgA [Nitrospirales bacterium]
MNLLIIVSLLVSALSGSNAFAQEKGELTKSAAGPLAKTPVVSIGELKAAIVKKMQSRIPSSDMKLAVEVLFPKTPVPVPKGRITLHVPDDQFGNAVGRRAFRVRITLDDTPVKTVSVLASVTLETEVVTPVRWIKVHEILREEDLVRKTVSLRTFTPDILRRLDDVVGKQATRSLPPHQPLSASFVSDPPLVHKGDRVMIEVRRGGLFIQTIGVAKASGQSGELIPVTNQSSGREILATILSPGIVEVRF